MSIGFSDHVAWQVVGSEAVVIDLRSGSGIGLNGTAAFVWSRLASQPPASIAADLAASFAVTSEAALRDVLSFVEELRRRGLVVDR